MTNGETITEILYLILLLFGQNDNFLSSRRSAQQHIPATKRKPTVFSASLHSFVQTKRNQKSSDINCGQFLPVYTNFN